MPGINETIETIGEIENLAVDAIALAKGKINILALPKIMKVLSDLSELSDIKNVLPELKDLDASESGQIMEASYAAILSIVAALKK